ncbi:MAG: DUF1894 domain-containing protein [Candidatus Methanoperedens sp.]|nr:DUF1894 domain-containing protein [Candidatus Methanoperedens sp.]MCE8429186.1 DUF1894 domain-containing protein [Candidatus Methanoperedens sp.]
MGCVDEMNYEILLPNSSFKECAVFIKSNFKEIYYVEAGFKIFDNYLIGVPPIPIAVDGDFIIMPYVKPCHGCFVLRIPGKEEGERLRTREQAK